MSQKVPPLPGTQWDTKPMGNDQGDEAPKDDWVKHRYDKHPDTAFEKDTEQDNPNPIPPSHKSALDEPAH